MTTTPGHVHRHLLIKQRFTLGVNRYEIRESDTNATEGTLIGFAQQKRFKLKEEVTFWADDSKTQPVFSFKARNVFDIKSVADIFDAQHQPIGSFRKDFGASFIRSTWYLTQASGQEYRGQERSMPLAIIRRLMDVAFIPYHFEFIRADGVPGFSIEKKWGIRDKYVIKMYDDALDPRAVGVMGVALDTLQNR